LEGRGDVRQIRSARALHLGFEGHAGAVPDRVAKTFSVMLALREATVKIRLIIQSSALFTH
jgi:hypothetical protein